VVAHDGEVDVLYKLWEWAQKLLNTEELNNCLLLAKDDEDNTVLQYTSFCDNGQTLGRIRNCAKVQLPPEVLNNKLLLAQIDHRISILLVAKGHGKIQLFGILWVLANEVLTSQDLKIRVC
jgi:hypothetical protein